jgi:hypothetical protein
MAEVPDEMLTKDRPGDPIFTADERLFRRLKPDALDGTRIAPDAIELPDMSVNRSKYGPPEWLLLDDEFQAWGVFAFRVGDIASELLDKAVTKYTFDAQHRPLKYNYPHTEIWAYRDGEHIDAKKALLLDPGLHQRWRQMLAWKCRIVIAPGTTT